MVQILFPFLESKSPEKETLRARNWRKFIWYKGGDSINNIVCLKRKIML
jgi:hypothetical protein